MRASIATGNGRRWPACWTIDEAIFSHPLADGEREVAARALQDHLRHGEATTLEYLLAEPVPPAGVIPAYLRRMDDDGAYLPMPAKARTKWRCARM